MDLDFGPAHVVLSLCFSFFVSVWVFFCVDCVCMCLRICVLVFLSLCLCFSAFVFLCHCVFVCLCIVVFVCVCMFFFLCLGFSAIMAHEFKK